MTDEKKERWLNYLALTTVILAVCATLSSFRGSSYSTRAVMSQTQAASQWSYYQSKSIKGYLYELRKEELEAGIAAEAARLPERSQAIYRDLAGSYAREIARYDGEKAQIQAEAKTLELRRDHAQAHSRTFGMAVIFLQIAILMSSVAALLRRKALWLFGTLLGSVGVVYFVLGLLPSRP
ncbi:MAG: DUF4337 domain-containing protein [Candidatus Krumholzibacteriia bacterium]